MQQSREIFMKGIRELNHCFTALKNLIIKKVLRYFLTTLKVFNSEKRHHHCLNVFNTKKGLYHFLRTIKVFNIEKELHHFLETLKGFNFEQ